LAEIDSCGVVQPNYSDCCLPAGNQTPPQIIEGPPGPPGPQGPPGLPNTKFAFVYTFGDSINTMLFGTKIVVPSPYSGLITGWRARHSGDLTATALFAVSKAPSVTGVLAAVGGTAPAIAAAKGAESLSIDWTISTVLVGEALEVEYVSGDSKGVTIEIECSII